MHHKSHDERGLHPEGSASRGVGQTPQHTTEYGQRVVGTHPTGMHFDAPILHAALFTKPPSSILPAVGTTLETISAAGPIHGLRDFQELSQSNS